MQSKHKEDEAFYSACAEILGIEHEYQEPPRRRNRWNARRLGNGRFPGFGLVRAYGPLVIVISTAGTKDFKNREAALDYLRDFMNERCPKPF